MTTVWNQVSKPSVLTWTSVPKASLMSGTMVLTTAGEPIGLLMALTYPVTSSVITAQSWKNVTKASGTGWTSVPKAT